MIEDIEKVAVEFQSSFLLIVTTLQSQAISPQILALKIILS